jgi:hypothetical protein
MKLIIRAYISLLHVIGDRRVLADLRWRYLISKNDRRELVVRFCFV